MSDSWIAWKPRTEEPSKFRPSSKTAWSNDETGTVKCCMMPGRSQNRTSTISTPSSLMYFSSSSLFANIRPPWPPVRGGQQSRASETPVRRCTGAARNLGRGSFLTVSGLFRRCNRCPAGREAPATVGSLSRCPRRRSRPRPGAAASSPCSSTGSPPPWSWSSCSAPAGWSDSRLVRRLHDGGLHRSSRACCTALVGGSFGKLATRLRVVRDDGSGRPSTSCARCCVRCWSAW